MYQGYTESQERIEARKARILADYQPEPAPAETVQAEADNPQVGTD
jgi:hypothetical protein